MALTQLAPPYPIFTDKSGSPLDNGYLYFGEVNKNPETNPIQVYYDSAFTQPAAQPLRTSNGYVMRNGSPALIYADSQFSVTIRDKSNALVIYSPVGYGVDPASISGTVVYDDFTGDGSTVVFTLSASPSTKNATNVYIDGVYQSKDNYSTSGSTLTFSTAPPLNSAIEVVTQESSIIGGASSQQITYNQGSAGSVTRTVQSRLQDFVSVKDFGAVGDGVTDDTVAIQAALNATASKTLLLVSGETYKCTTGLTVQGSIQGNGAVLNFYGATAGGTNNSCVYQTAEGSLTGFTIDATNVTSCQAGLWVNTDFAQQATCFYDLTVQNISNTDNTQAAYGALFFKSSSATHLDSDLDIKIKAINVVANANGVIGDTGGSARAIGTSFNGTGTNCRVNIHDCYVENISSGPSNPQEDSDGIGLYQGDKSTAGAKGLYVIQNCYVKDAFKRSIKIQAPNTLVLNCTGEGALSEGFSAYAIDTTFDNCRFISAGTANGFSLNDKGGKVLNCYGKGTNFAVLRVYPSATQSLIDGCEFVYDATVSVDKNLRAVAFLYGVGIQMSNCVLTNTTNTGTGVAFSNASLDCQLFNIKINTVEYGISFLSCGGKVQFDNCQINSTVQAAYIYGNNILSVSANNCNFLGSGTGLALSTSAGANEATLFLSSCKVTTGSLGYGVTCGAGSMICGNEFKSASTTQPGIIGGNDITVSGNVVRGYQYALQYPYTTTAVILNNISIGATTGLANKTGYTPFAESNNYAR